MHQPPSKEESSVARFTSLSQQGREMQKQQQLRSNAAATSESAQEREGSSLGRQQVRLANLAKPTYQNLHVLWEAQNTYLTPWRSWGEMTMDLRRSHFSSAGHGALCEGVQQSQPWQSLLPCLPLQLCAQITQNPRASTALLLDVRCSCLTEVAHEPCILTQSLQHSDLSSPCHPKQPSWKLVTLHRGRDGLGLSCSLWGKKKTRLHFSSELQCTSLLVLCPEYQTHQPIGTGLPYWVLQGSLNTNLNDHLISALKIVGGEGPSTEKNKLLRRTMLWQSPHVHCTWEKKSILYEWLLGIKEIHELARQTFQREERKMTISCPFPSQDWIHLRVGEGKTWGNKPDLERDWSEGVGKKFREEKSK